MFVGEETVSSLRFALGNIMNKSSIVKALMRWTSMLWDHPCYARLCKLRAVLARPFLVLCMTIVVSDMIPM